MSKEGSSTPGEDGATENPQAELRKHAVGLEMGRTSSANHGHEDEDEEDGDERLPPRQTAIPFHSMHNVHMVEISQKMLFVFYGCGAMFAAFILWQIISQHKERHVIAWCVGAIFVSIAVPFSLHDIYMHTIHVRTFLDGLGGDEKVKKIRGGQVNLYGERACPLTFADILCSCLISLNFHLLCPSSQ